MSGRAHGDVCPERTCVGCRQRAAKDDLLRIAVVGNECVPDPRGTLPGRGAYVHPDLACYDLAVRRRAFPRAYRSKGPLATEGVRQGIEHAARNVRRSDAAHGKERHG